MRIMPCYVAKNPKPLALKKVSISEPSQILQPLEKQYEPVKNVSFNGINKNKLCDAIAGGVIGTVFGIVGFSIAGPIGAAILGGLAAKTAYDANEAHLDDEDDKKKNE